MPLRKGLNGFNDLTATIQMTLLLRWMRYFSQGLLALVLYCHPILIQASTNSASIYAEVEKSVYTVQVINRHTGEKIYIGSGFVVGRDDLLATNYHVVSTYINDPDNFTIDYLANNGSTGELKLLDVDIINDLAVLKAHQPLGTPLVLGTVPKKGASLYSLGNPLGLGFSIVPGTNNGALEYSIDQKILFSGSLNSGMSGGPTLDEQGQVVGINVATSGNQISFLVGTQHLAIILERLKQRDYKPVDNIKAYVVHHLIDNTKNYMLNLIKGKANKQWKYGHIGEFKVPTALNPSIRCWDVSEPDNRDSLISNNFTLCSNERSIYLRDGISAGSFQYQYDWYEGKDLLPIHFYRLYESKNGVEPLNTKLTPKDVTMFKCFTHFVEVTQKPIKMSICRRDYKEYKGLSDLMVNGVLVGEKNKGMVFNIDIAGADFESSLELVEVLLGGFEWKN